MESAAAEYAFEKASSLRDKLQAIEWLDARLSLIRKARENNSFVYPLVGSDGRERWYLINRGQVRAVCYPPGCEENVKRLTDAMATAFSDRPEAVVLSGRAVDCVLLVAAWFRKHADERTRLLTRKEAVERSSVTVSLT
jgi:excinuclease ABC subunit C